MNLSDLSPQVGSKKRDDFRRGRGHGSGNGKTAGKGHKGQKARSGAPRLGFEGGQMPLYRRIPKRGFHNHNRLEVVTLNVQDLERFENGTNVTIELLLSEGVIKNPKDAIKILGNGELTKKLTVEACGFSKSAQEKIEKAGGECKLYEGCCCCCGCEGCDECDGCENCEGHTHNEE